MSEKGLTKRESHIMETMGLDASSTKSVSEIGRLSGSHKYDVWIGREISKDKDLIDRVSDFQFIIDWAKKDKPNIFSYSFSEAYKSSENWHKKLKFNTKEKEFKEKDDERIVYRCKDNEHFFILLLPKELKIEGNIMRNCVGSYSNKVSLGKSLIISLRDKKNQPHVTIEIDIKTSSVTQVRGKANTQPSNEYMKLITEFAIYASGYEEDVDEDLMDLINLKFN